MRHRIQNRDVACLSRRISIKLMTGLSYTQGTIYFKPSLTLCISRKLLRRRFRIFPIPYTRSTDISLNATNTPIQRTRTVKDVVASNPDLALCTFADAPLRHRPFPSPRSLVFTRRDELDDCSWHRIPYMALCIKPQPHSVLNTHTNRNDRGEERTSTLEATSNPQERIIPVSVIPYLRGPPFKTISA